MATAQPPPMTCSEEHELEENLSKRCDSIFQSLASDKYQLSVLIMGGSQAGKSSLVKAVFGDEKIAIGSDGRPVTQDIGVYNDPKGNFQLIDTPGLEKDVTKDIVARIGKQLQVKKIKPSIIWIVLNIQTAIEDVELNLVNVVPDTPVIFILSKCDFLQRRKSQLQDNPHWLEKFDLLSVNDLPEWMNKKEHFMAKRNRLLNWRQNHNARVKRIVITSLGANDQDDDVDDPDKPIGLEALLEATFGCLDDVGRVLFAEAQQSGKIEKVNGSVAIILASTASAAGKSFVRNCRSEFAHYSISSDSGNYTYK